MTHIAGALALFTLWALSAQAQDLNANQPNTIYDGGRNTTVDRIIVTADGVTVDGYIIDPDQTEIKVLIDGADNVTIRNNLIQQLTGTGDNAYALRIRGGSQNTVIEYNEFKDTNGIQVLGFNEENANTGTIIRGNYFHGDTPGRPDFVQDASERCDQGNQPYVYQTQILNNLFDLSGDVDEMISVKAGYTTISGNTFETGIRGPVLRAPHNVTISDNYFDDTVELRVHGPNHVIEDNYFNSTPIKLYKGKGPFPDCGNQYWTVENILIDGNQFDNGTVLYLNSDLGTNAANTDGVTISNNVSDATQGNTVDEEGAQNVTYSGNTWSGTPTVGTKLTTADVGIGAGGGGGGQTGNVKFFSGGETGDVYSCDSNDFSEDCWQWGANSPKGRGTDHCPQEAVDYSIVVVEEGEIIPGDPTSTPAPAPRAGNKLIRFETRDDWKCVFGNYRNRAVRRNSALLGEELWVGYSYYTPSSAWYQDGACIQALPIEFHIRNQATGGRKACMLKQQHKDSGNGECEIQMFNYGDLDQSLWYDRWLDVVYHYSGSDPTNSLGEVWIDGTKVWSKTWDQTCGEAQAGHEVQFRIGQYQYPVPDLGTVVSFVDEVRIAGADGSYGDVAPGGAPPPPPPPPAGDAWTGAPWLESFGAWTYCSDEGGTCAFNGVAQVRYGKVAQDPDAIFVQMHENSVPCNNAQFGDPLKGVLKECHYRLHEGDLDEWTTQGVALQHTLSTSTWDGGTNFGVPVGFDLVGSTYYLWYLAGFQGSWGAGPSHQSLGLATSTDGITYTAHPNNPILKPHDFVDVEAHEEGIRFARVRWVPALNTFVGFFSVEDPGGADACPYMGPVTQCAGDIDVDAYIYSTTSTNGLTWSTPALVSGVGNASGVENHADDFYYNDGTGQYFLFARTAEGSPRGLPRVYSGSLTSMSVVGIMPTALKSTDTPLNAWVHTDKDIFTLILNPHSANDQVSTDILVAESRLSDPRVINNLRTWYSSTTGDESGYNDSRYELLKDGANNRWLSMASGDVQAGRGGQIIVRSAPTTGAIPTQGAFATTPGCKLTLQPPFIKCESIEFSENCEIKTSQSISTGIVVAQDRCSAVVLGPGVTLTVDGSFLYPNSSGSTPTFSGLGTCTGSGCN